MENKTRKLAVTAGMTVAIFAALGAPAGAEPDRRIVLHVRFSDATTPRQLETFAQAQEHAAEIYDAIGVTLAWTTESLAEGTDKGVMHLGVRALSDARTKRFLKDSPRASKKVLGAAPEGTNRVYVFWDRIVRLAETESVLTSVVLGRVIAHEVGHHLLPAAGHSRDGLMRTTLNYKQPKPPAFTAQQTESIRARLFGAD